VDRIYQNSNVFPKTLNRRSSGSAFGLASALFSRAIHLLTQVLGYAEQKLPTHPSLIQD